jgi:hypothetical protein
MFMNQDHEEIDPRLEALLANLRATPARDRQKAELGKAQFLAEADQLFVNQPAAGRKSVWSAFKDKLAFTNAHWSHRAALASLIIIFALFALLSGSAGMTVVAARAALPGDALYGVKTRLEDTRANLTNSAARQVTLQLQYAQRRLDEIEKLIADGRYADIQVAAQDFQVHIQNTLAAMSDEAAGDPVKAAELAAQISSQLTRYAQALSGMADQTPAPARSELEKALQATQRGEFVETKPDGEVEITGLIETIQADQLIVGGQTVQLNGQTELKLKLAVGMLVNVHAYLDTTGNIIAREIVVISPVQNDSRESVNSNENDRKDTNANEREVNTNANDSGSGKEDGSNVNADSNANEDSRPANSNTNENESGDQGSNSNEEHGNQNSNDSGGNTNEEKRDNNDNKNDNSHRGG